MNTDNRSRSLTFALLTLAVAAALPAAAWAEVYTDQATFLAATDPGDYLETFDSLPQFTPTDGPLDFFENGFSYNATTASGNAFFNIGSGSDTWLSTFHEFDPIVFTFTSNNVTAVGGNFFLTDEDGNIVDGTLTVTLDDGSTFSISDASLTSFIGFTTVEPIESLTVTPPASGDSFLFATVNDFITGEAVPEPATWELLGFGGLAVLSLRLCRRFSN